MTFLIILVYVIFPLLFLVHLINEENKAMDEKIRRIRRRSVGR
jgi:hypothetical protein